VPPLPLPPELDAFLALPNPAIVGTVRPDGSPHTVPTWYDWEDGRVLMNLDARRLRLEYMRSDPRVSLTVLSEDWYEHVSLLGRIVEIHDDADFADIDRLCGRYQGHPFRTRDRERVSVWMEPQRWHGWGESGNLVPR
jgi:PPOX class probable F420-dependent enzyme